MKRHAIIPIFIPHQGCPNDCAFCNQRLVTARSAAPSAPEMAAAMDAWLSTLTNPRPPVIEVALYGGSFTGLPRDQQARYLQIALSYKQKGLVDRIRLSTRPDYIDEDILLFLKGFQVDVIELGAQSFDQEVLRLSNRGHDSAAIYQSSRLIRRFGFTLGLQLMVGLPGDSYEKALFSAREAVFCRPAMARLYPTVILEGTDLSRRYKEGLYRPFSQEEMLRATKDMYRILTGAGIQIIRVGLKSSDLVRNDGQGVLGNSFHPAFRQLVEGELAKEDLEKQLLSLLSRKKNQAPSLCPSSLSSFSPLSDSSGKAGGKKQIGRVRFLCHPRSFSNMLGNKGRNRAYFQNHYPFLTFRFQTDSSMKPGLYRALME